MSELTITYETLFEILRREKSRAELQKLGETFLQDVRNYLEEKKQVLVSDSEQNPFSADERNKTLGQLENIRSILRELYSKREKKILNLALDKSRTASDLIDTSVLLQEERQLFESVVADLGRSRENILTMLLEPGKKRETAHEPAQQQENSKEVSRPASESLLVRFIHAVPKFVGKELEVYGPFEEEDIANLPREIAEVLIKKGRAEEIKEN